MDVERKTESMLRDGNGDGRIMVIFDFHERKVTSFRTVVAHGRQALK